MTANQRILACVVAGILWLAAIIAKHFWADIDIGAFMMACAGVITALGVHGAATGSAPLSTLVQTPAPAPAIAIPGQTGRSLWAYPMLLLTVVLAGLSLLAGCTTTTASVYSGLYTQAKAGVQVFDDNTLNTASDILCAQPYAAIQRHPEKQPGIVTLCGPMSNTASLDPAQVMQMLSIAKQLGLVPAAVPAASAASGAK